MGQPFNGALEQAEAQISKAVIADLKHAIDFLIEHYPGNEGLIASNLMHRAAAIAHDIGTDVPLWLRSVAGDIENDLKGTE